MPGSKQQRRSGWKRRNGPEKRLEAVGEKLLAASGALGAALRAADGQSPHIALLSVNAHRHFDIA